MKKLTVIICLLMLMFSVTCFAQGKMYPHDDVKTDMTAIDGEVKATSGRAWKTVSGEVTREDMEHGELRYTVYLPNNYDINKEYPLFLSLHGGYRGYKRTDSTPWEIDFNNVTEQYAEQIALALGDCIIFLPQAPGAPLQVKDARNAYWSELPTGMVSGKADTDSSSSSPYLRAVEKMLSEYTEKGISSKGNVYKIDSSRLYVAGHSMGGIGTYTILRDCPDVFAGAIIGAGIGDPDTADSWGNTKVRIFHGKQDKTIPVKTTEIMMNALKTSKNAEFFLLDGKGHEILPVMYDTDERFKYSNLKWLSEQDLDKTGNISLYVSIAVLLVLFTAAVIVILKFRKAKQ